MNMADGSPIKVLVVDDSASVRAMMRRIIEGDSALSFMAGAPDAFAAAKLMKEELPDVLLLDIEMPGMDGLSFLRKIMAQHPLPVVICSSLTASGSATAVAALEAGAVDVVQKPASRDPLVVQEATVRICDALRGAAQVGSLGGSKRKLATSKNFTPGPKLSPDAILPPPLQGRPAPRTDPIVVIGASTGGTEALREVLQALPEDSPPIAIVQHMPQGFTAAFARRMNEICAVAVREAAEGDLLTQGTVLIAPGRAC